jgi:hypothetical protein
MNDDDLPEDSYYWKSVSRIIGFFTILIKRLILKSQIVI